MFCCMVDSFIRSIHAHCTRLASLCTSLFEMKCTYLYFNFAGDMLKALSIAPYLFPDARCKVDPTKLIFFTEVRMLMAILVHMYIKR